MVVTYIMNKFEKNIDDKIVIMHISDIHCGMKNDTHPAYMKQRKQVIDAFFRDIDNIKTEWKPDIIAISGDLGWSGSAEDYEEFGTFLKRLLEKTGLQSESVICCPGNHDKHLPKTATSLKDIQDYYAVDSVLRHINELSSDFTSYSDELKKIGISPLENKAMNPTAKYLFGYRNIRGIDFVVLNSAWLCDYRKDKKFPHADRGNLLFDHDIICSLLGDEDESNIKVFVYHHPDSWLREGDQIGIGTPTALDEIHKNADIILNGHLHEARKIEYATELQFQAGTVSSNDVYQSHCYLLKVIVDKTNFQLSQVHKAEYLSEWIDRTPKWRFREDAAPKFLNKDEAANHYKRNCDNIIKVAEWVKMLVPNPEENIEIIEDIRARLDTYMAELEENGKIDKENLNELLEQLKQTLELSTIVLVMFERLLNEQDLYRNSYKNQEEQTLVKKLEIKDPKSTGV